MRNWYKTSQKLAKTPWKILVYDNYSDRGIHTPDLFQGRWVNATSEAQAWAILSKTWPTSLLNRIDEYKQRGITVRLFIDEEEQKRREFIEEEQEKSVANMWWQD